MRTERDAEDQRATNPAAGRRERHVLPITDRDVVQAMADLESATEEDKAWATHMANRVLDLSAQGDQPKFRDASDPGGASSQ